MFLNPLAMFQSDLLKIAMNFFDARRSFGRQRLVSTCQIHECSEWMGMEQHSQLHEPLAMEEYPTLSYKESERHLIGILTITIYPKESTMGWECHYCFHGKNWKKTLYPGAIVPFQAISFSISKFCYVKFPIRKLCWLDEFVHFFFLTPDLS